VITSLLPFVPYRTHLMCFALIPSPKSSPLSGKGLHPFGLSAVFPSEGKAPPSRPQCHLGNAQRAMGGWEATCPPIAARSAEGRLHPRVSPHVWLLFPPHVGDAGPPPVFAWLRHAPRIRASPERVSLRSPRHEVTRAISFTAVKLLALAPLVGRLRRPRRRRINGSPAISYYW